MSCADGLFFNHERGICDWKHNVDCGDRNIPDDKPNSGENDGGDDDDKGQGDGNENEDVDICALPGKDVPESGVLENGCPIDPTVHWLLPHEKDCNKFYYCVNGAKIEQQCFGPLHFNSRLQDRDGISLTAILFLATASATLDEPICPKQNEANWEVDIFLPHRKCDRFYQCTNDEPIEISCPEGLYFSTIKNICDWKDFVECGDRVLPDSFSLDSSELFLESEVSPSAGSPVRNVTIEDYPYASKASHTGFLKNGCPTDNNLIWLLPHERYCNWFYILISAVLFFAVASAASALNFCPKIQEVDWEIELLLPHWECNKFYQCTHGTPVEMICPKGLYFSIIKNKCDWRDLVKCGDRIVWEEFKPEVTKEPDTTSVTERNENDNIVVETEKPESPIEFLPNGCPVDPEVHWLLPNEKFCNLFYYCVEGEKEIRRCPFWLHFNRELQVCDWPRNSGCVDIYRN
ncbi:Chondroitin proteoglycan 2 [Papilio xuthus]|uniref:Chondroitin proteoglycan 2 n=1 Tax=Papilio xuthus TaxID=66420 RepID=A0A194PZ97_PAPXU|nr:Chondroitin proteoglycan 2 [Papilio xuthus]